jgi:lipopolysaccharide export system permease protein
VFGTILFRMILWELCKVFLMSLVGITGILLMAGIIAEASQQGLGPTQILAAIPLLIPSTLPYTIPATTLFATCVVYGRLSADNEILAIKSSGVNILNVVKAGIILGVVMSGVTMGLYYRIIPYTHHLLRAMVFNDAEELLYTMLRKHGMINHPQLNYAMFVKGVQGKKLLSPVFKRKNRQGQIDIVANAREAELLVQVGANGKNILFVKMRGGVASSEVQDRAYFEERVFEVELPSMDAGKQRRARDMTWQEMLEERRHLEEKKEKKAAEIATRSAESLALSQPPYLVGHIKNLENELQRLEQQVVLLDVEMLMRPALSAGCLCFILVGCPIGIWFSRSDYLSSFITCFLPIVFVYYPLMLCGTNMAKEGKHSPALLVWAADLVVASMGVLLFRKLMKN